MTTIYMIVTDDEYRLPVCWGESTAELARLAGLDYSSVRKNVLAAMHGKRKRTKYEIVRLEDDEE